MTTEHKPKSGLSNASFIGLILVFLVPLIIATLLYSYRDWLPLPEPKTNGVLIHPARPISQFGARSTDGKALSLDHLRGKWTLVYFAGSRCDLYCEASLFKMRQARLALGENMSRVQRLLLFNSTAGLDDLATLLGEHPKLITASVSDNMRTAVLESFGERPEGNVYIVDPLGNVMMRYPPNATTEGLLKDLKHLLKVSQIG